jgi:hypothetical protein
MREPWFPHTPNQIISEGFYQADFNSNSEVGLQPKKTSRAHRGGARRQPKRAKYPNRQFSGLTGSVAFDLVKQPGLGVGPIIVGGARGNVHDLRAFLQRQPDEVT